MEVVACLVPPAGLPPAPLTPVSLAHALSFWSSLRASPPHELRHEMRDLKEALAEQVLENRLLKKSMIGDGGDGE